MRKTTCQKLDFVRANAELRKVNRLCDRKQAFVDAVGTFRGQLYPDLKCESQRQLWAVRTKKSQTIQLEWMQNCGGYKAVSIISPQRFGALR